MSITSIVVNNIWKTMRKRSWREFLLRIWRQVLQPMSINRNWTTFKIDNQPSASWVYFISTSLPLVSISNPWIINNII